MFNNDEEKEKKLDWMYKGPYEMVNREDYLLGKSVDKSLEELNVKEKQKEQGIVIPQPKNHVEHECIPPSIRDYNKIVQSEQVDLSAKLQEDPLVAIRKKEEETRRQFLQNPVQLKKLQEALQEQMAKKKKKKRKQKHSDSDDDIDAKLTKKLKLLKDNPLAADISKKSKKKSKNSSALDTILKHKYNEFKDKLSESDLNDILNGNISDESESERKKKKKKKKHRKTEGERKVKKKKSKERNETKDKHDSEPEGVEERERKIREIHQQAKDNRSKYVDKIEKDDKNHRDRSDFRREKDSYRNSSPSYSRQHNYQKIGENSSRQYRDYEKNKRFNDGDPHRSYDNDHKRSRKDSDTSKRRRSEDVDDYYKKAENRYEKSKRNSIEKSTKEKDVVCAKEKEVNVVKEKEDRNGKGKEIKDHNKQKENTEKLRKLIEQISEAKRRQRKRSRSEVSEESSSSSSDTDNKANWGLVKADGSKLSLRGRTENATKIERTNKPTEEKRPIYKNEHKKLTEEEKEKRRKEMLENAVWRDKERERNVKRYREKDEKEKANSGEYDKEFLMKELLKSANSSSVESRIKSNLNNIQRSGAAMEKHFSRRN